MANDDAGELPQQFIVAKKLLHPEYVKKPSFINDIAILTLEKDVQILDERVRPICLQDPTLTKNLFQGFHPHVAGWGAVGYRDPTSSELMEVQLEVS